MAPPAGKSYQVELWKATGWSVIFNGLFEPWPQNPQPRYERQGEFRQMIAGWNAIDQEPIPGEVVYQDFGVAISTGEVEIRLYGDEAVRDDLETQWLLPESLNFSPDGRITIYSCVWAPGRSFEAIEQPGFAGNDGDTEAYTIILRLRVISQS